MDYEFDFSFLDTYWDALLQGTWLTVRMSAITVVTGFIVGVALAVARTHGPRWLQKGVAVYVEVLRNTPLVVQAFWLFFGLAAIQVRVSAFAAAIFALTINVSAYTAEIVRAGMESIPKGQVEAASCLGMSKWKVLRLVILPQAIERMYPSLASQFILMMLATSIMSQISTEELTAAGYSIQSETFRGFEIYLVIAAIYLLLSWVMRMVMAGVAQASFARLRRLKTPL